MQKAININTILETDDVHAFIDFLRISSKTKNVKLLLPAFEDFMPASAIECKNLVNFIRERNGTDLDFLLTAYTQKLSGNETKIQFYSKNEPTL